MINILVFPLRKMEEYGLITKETLKDLIFEKFEKIPDYPKTAEEEDPLIHVNSPLSIGFSSDPSVSSDRHIFTVVFLHQGEFEVIKQLVSSTPGTSDAKR